MKKFDDALNDWGKKELTDFEARAYAAILLQALWIKTTDWSREREFRAVRDIGGKDGGTCPLQSWG